MPEIPGNTKLDMKSEETRRSTEAMIPLSRDEATTRKKPSDAVDSSNESPKAPAGPEFEYPPMKRVIVVMIAVYLSMFLVALVSILFPECQDQPS
jgi:hypothetical protein